MYNNNKFMLKLLYLKCESNEILYQKNLLVFQSRTEMKTKQLNFYQFPVTNKRNVHSNYNILKKINCAKLYILKIAYKNAAAMNVFKAV